MENEPISKETESKKRVDSNAEGVTTHQHHVEGTGSCTICDCKEFIPSQGGEICQNRNSSGGTCTHRKSEHN